MSKNFIKKNIYIYIFSFCIFLIVCLERETVSPRKPWIESLAPYTQGQLKSPNLVQYSGAWVSSMESFLDQGLATQHRATGSEEDTLRRSAVQYSEVQLGTVQYTSVECSTVRCSAVHFSAVQYTSVLLMGFFGSVQVGELGAV